MKFYYEVSYLFIVTWKVYFFFKEHTAMYNISINFVYEMVFETSYNNHEQETTTM